MPKLVLVCGFYNRPLLVKRTLMGLRQQTEHDAEFYIFDDGSTDNTFDVLVRTIDRLRDNRFKLIRHDTNKGLTRGLIDAVEATDSDLVAIHDAGDFSLPVRLEAQAAAFLERDDRVVVGSHYINYVEDVGINRLRQPNADTATLESLLVDPTFTHGEVMFRRHAYEQAGGYRPEFRYSQDNDLWLRMIGTGSFHTVPKTLYVRCIQFSGISYNSETFAKQSAFYVLGKMMAVGQRTEQHLKQLREGADIFDIVSKRDPAVQRVLLRGAIRALLLGSPENAGRIAELHLTPGYRAELVKVTARLMSLPPSKLLRGLAWEAGGLRYRRDELEALASAS